MTPLGVDSLYNQYKNITGCQCDNNRCEFRTGFFTECLEIDNILIADHHLIRNYFTVEQYMKFFVILTKIDTAWYRFANLFSVHNKNEVVYLGDNN